jgi:hypothetical protein
MLPIGDLPADNVLKAIVPSLITTRRSGSTQNLSGAIHVVTRRSPSELVTNQKAIEAVVKGSRNSPT